MSPFVIVPRAPQATPSSPASVTQTTSRASSSSTSTWDTRVGSPVFTTYEPITQPTASTGDSQSSSGGFLSSKGAVAGLCVGIALVCVIVAAFFIYRIKYRNRPRLSKVPTPKSSSPFPTSSTFTRISKQAPSPFQIGSRHRHPLEDGVSRSASQSTGRSFQPSHLSSTRGQLRAGDVIEITHIGYQHTNSSASPSVSASGQNPTRRTSETGVGAGALISEYKPHTPPSRSLERLSSVTGTGSHTSMLDSSSYTSRSHLLSQAQLITNTSEHSVNIVLPTRRPLPIPPHPPPAYEQVSSTGAQVVSAPPNNSIDAEPLTGSTLAGIQSPNVKAQAHARLSSADETQYSRAPSLDPGVIPVLSSVSENAKMGSSRGEPGYPRRSVDVTADVREDDDLDMETAMTPHSHRRHPSSGDHDPFVNMNYELPAWLTSDPYPAQRLRPSASQPSLYGAVARSVAASSRVLPSDSSIRTLTPEPISSPLSPLPGEEAMSPSGPPNEAASRRYSQAPTYVSTLPPTRPVSAIVGDGPAVDELLVFHGAERPGWAESSPLPSSRSSGFKVRRKFPTDRFEAEDLHPAASRGAAPNSPGSSTAASAANSRSADRETTFMPLSPLSEVAPVQGLSRAFSLDAPQRRAFTPRGRGRATGRSPLLDRSFGTFSSFRGARTGYSSGMGIAETPLSASSSRRISADDRARDSVVPSSSGLPPDVMSIRSISPEIGWMEDPALPDSGIAQEHLASIKEGEQNESDPTEAPAFGANEASGRASRMSITEDVALWGRLTSALEQEQRPSEPQP